MVKRKHRDFLRYPGVFQSRAVRPLMCYAGCIVFDKEALPLLPYAAKRGCLFSATIRAD